MKNAKLLVLALALAATTSIGIQQASADAPVIAIAGTVVSRDGDRLVVRTDKGDLTFDIDKTTEMPTGGELPVGSRITVWYDSDDKVTDRMDARKIELLPAVETQTAPPPTPVQAQPQTQVQTQTEVTQTTQEELPATASPLPLFGAAGALALLGGALLLRRSRRA